MNRLKYNVELIPVYLIELCVWNSFGNHIWTANSANLCSFTWIYEYNRVSCL